MAGVSDTFKISDELYHFNPDKVGTSIEVLATAKNPATGKTYPSIWIVKHPKARIVCVAPGHDGAAHGLGAYKIILRNAVKWTAGK
jgi:type 1 glutamine amidotransferase